ncbi:hypothetical protein FOZ63_003037, partial [Perkinsus olseni]
QYYFISGYTAKVAGTEQGITEPTATFSACFGAPFLVWHPVVYAEMLSHKIQKHKCTAYLLNTGWIGGGYGEGKRCSLKYTRKMIDAMHDGTLKAMVDDGEHNFDTLPLFNLKVPKSLPGVPEHILYPKDGWEDKEKFDATLTKLAKLFEQNFQDLLAKVLNLPEMPVYPLTAEEAAAIYGRHLADDDEDKCGDHGQLEAGGICECDANWYHIQIDDGSVMWCAYNNRETPDIPGYYWEENGLRPGEYELFPSREHLDVLDMRFWIFGLLIFECWLLCCCRFIRDRFCGPSVEEVIARLPPGYYRPEKP